MKSHIISLVILFSSLPSQAMLVRAVQPLARRIASRLLRPKAAPQKLVQQVPQTPVRTAPRAVVRQLTPRTPWQTKLFKPHPSYRSYAKPTWLLPAGIGTLCASTLLNRHAYAEPSTKPWAEVEKDYREQLKKIEQKYMQEIFELCGITKQEWQKYVSDAATRVAHQDKLRIKNLVCLASMDPDMHKKISFLLKKHLPEENIHLVYDGTVNPMGATMNVILVNPKQCNNLTEKEFESFALHEMQHIINKDCIQTVARRILCNEKGISIEKSKEILDKMDRFEEMRADILSQLSITPEHTRSFSLHFCTLAKIERLRITQITFKSNLEDVPSEGYSTHPFWYDRCNYLDKLHQDMLKQQN